MIRTSALAAVAVGIVLYGCTPAEERADDTARVDIVPADTVARTVHVVLNEWSVSPSESPLDGGRVTFHTMNEGQYQHALEIQREGQDWQTGNIPAGGTATVTVDLTPGTYTLYCPIVDAQGNHRERGMQTTLTVR